MSISNPPKALLTDVFGTVVDWRKTVTEHLNTNAHEALNSPSASLPSHIRTTLDGFDWGEFAQKWRNSYYEFTRTFNPENGDKFKTIDQHHIEALLKLIHEHHLEGLWDDVQIQKISLIWHILEPWPDSIQGMTRLNKKFDTATLSNGNRALLQDLKDKMHIPWKHICSAEDFGYYKPRPEVYNGGAQNLGFAPEDCALIAAHLNDLQAAKACGYQTIYIERKREEGWDEQKVQQAKKEGWVDMWVAEDEGGLIEVARRFGF